MIRGKLVRNSLPFVVSELLTLRSFDCVVFLFLPAPIISVEPSESHALIERHWRTL